MQKIDLPFCNAGLVEVVKRRVVAQTPHQAWADVVASASYLSDAERSEALSITMANRPPQEYQTGLFVDEQMHVIATQGGWWYRGVTAVQPHADGAIVTYVVVNVTPGFGRWIAHFFQAAEHRRAARQ